MVEELIGAKTFDSPEIEVGSVQAEEFFTGKKSVIAKIKQIISLDNFIEKNKLLLATTANPNCCCNLLTITLR